MGNNNFRQFIKRLPESFVPEPDFFPRHAVYMWSLVWRLVDPDILDEVRRWLAGVHSMSEDELRNVEKEINVGEGEER